MNVVSPSRAGALSPGELPAEAMDVSGKTAAEAAKEVAPLFHGARAVSVSSVSGKSGAVRGPRPGAPELDGLDEDLAEALTSDVIISMLGDLEKILAEAMTETNERQVQLAKERVESLQAQIESTKKERLGKVQKSMDEIHEAANRRTAMRVFGWFMTVLTVALAVVTTIGTGGAGAAFAIGMAAAAVALQVLNETGVTDSLAEKLTKALENAGCSKFWAAVLSAVIMAVGQVVISLAAGGVCSLGFMAVSRLASAGTAAVAQTASVAANQAAASATKEMVKATAKNIQLFMDGILLAGGIGMLGYSGYNAIKQFDASMERVKLKELESYIARLQQGLDEVNEELQKLVEQMQRIVADILKLVINPVETAGQMTQNFV